MAGFQIFLIGKYWFLIHFFSNRRFILSAIDGDDDGAVRFGYLKLPVLSETPFEESRIEHGASVSAEIGSREHEDGYVSNEARGVGYKSMEFFHSECVGVLRE